MQRNNTPVLIGTILFGLLALGLTMFYLFRPAAPVVNPATLRPTPTPRATSVYVASVDIPPRTLVTPEMLRLENSKPGEVTTDAIRSTGDIVGKITGEPIHQGQLVTLTSFIDPIHRVVSANIPVPSGMRAVAIWVDPDQTAAGLVDVGDRIDVIATHRLTWDKAPHQFVDGAVSFTAGRMIAQNLLVLAVNRSINAPLPTPTPVPGAAPAAPVAVASPTPIPAGSKTRVIVAAPPDVATDLVAANDQGTLHVVIRNPMDMGANTAVPVQREYPSRLFTVPDKTDGGGSGSRPVMPRMPRQPMPIMPSGGQMPMPVPTANTTEVTIIRSTEKTRAIVPG